MKKRKKQEPWTNERADAILAPLGGVRVGDVFLDKRGKKTMSLVSIAWADCPHGVTEVRCNNLATGCTTGCRVCGLAAYHAAQTAAALAQLQTDNPDLDLELTEPYVGFDSSRGSRKYARVAFTCQSCGERQAVLVTDFRKGGRCSACAKHGFDPSKPAYFYLLRRVKHGEEQRMYGITNNYKRRFKEHVKFGWDTAHPLDMRFSLDGYEIQNFESVIKDAMRKAGIHGSIYDSPGATEAWPESLLTPFNSIDALSAWAKRESRHLRSLA